VDYIEKTILRTEIDKHTILSWIEIHPGKYYAWKKRTGIDNHHNGLLPKSHWILPEEYKAVVIYVKHCLSKMSKFHQDSNHFCPLHQKML